jgi:hypothetical protein
VEDGICSDILRVREVFAANQRRQIRHLLGIECEPTRSRSGTDLRIFEDF